MDKTRLLRVIVFIIAFVPAVFAAEYCDNSTIDSELKEWVSGNCTLSDELMEELKEMRDQAFSPEGREAIANVMKEMTEYMDVGAENTENLSAKLADEASGADKILIFISESIPFKTLQNYINAADVNTTFVLRGPVGKDPSKLMPTMDFISKLVCGREYKNMTDSTHCLQRNIDINPPLFHEYGITKVPTIIVEKDNKTYRHIGAMPVNYVMEKIR